jgi:hypothetical protein
LIKRQYRADRRSADPGLLALGLPPNTAPAQPADFDKQFSGLRKPNWNKTAPRRACRRTEN